MQKRISFRKVDEVQDFPRLYQWMHKEHVIPYWNLNIPEKAYQAHLKKALDDQHQTLYIGYIDDKPMSYWEAYWVQEDVIENYYPFDTYDQGIHLLIGEEEFLGKGMALPLLRAMVQFQFLNQKTRKIVAEPDIRNEKMVHVFKKCGFEPVKPIQLPDKTGLLMYCQRQLFESRWSYGTANIFT
ncbi:GNAT family N-acetyltransferase [Metabacillus arenae]|uniref:Lysine N-acyltransferase MbtK n=1 Tax=Metabacillus arenae TaxID=2771434 RepID=A0A926NM54_9BACI|nr:acetyltransferase [Metabacillus arenae]